MTSTENIRAELCRYISENLLAENVSITPDTILSHIGIDSYSVVEIVLFIERKYGVIIPDNMLTPDNMKTVSAISNCVAKLSES